MKLKTLLLTLLSFIVLNSIASADYKYWKDDIWKKGFYYYKDKEYEKALNVWRPMAEQGNATAQYDLGSMYRNGLGVPKVPGIAIDWYRKSANQGYSDAQNTLGVFYLNGIIVLKDPKEAAKWFEKSANQGDVGSQRQLGLMYADGNGVPKDMIKAKYWIKKAYDGGYVSAKEDWKRLELWKY